MNTRVHIGVDAVGGTSRPGYDISPCDLQGGPGQISFGVGGTPAQVRVEMYPGVCGRYNGWENVGGVHIEARLGGGDLGAIAMPVDGQDGAFAIRGSILSSSKIADGRVVIDTFQIPTGYPDPPAPLQNNGRVEYGAFASTANRGSTWSGGIGWAGRYILFITDNATGTRITATPDIRPGAIPTIDLDAVCFGFDTCNYLAGGPRATAGTFHAMAPTRILDTRRAFGFFGPVQTGDGRNSSPDPITRRDGCRQPRSPGDRTLRRAGQRRVGGAAERHRRQRRDAGTRLHVGDPETTEGR